MKIQTCYDDEARLQRVRFIIEPSDPAHIDHFEGTVTLELSAGEWSKVISIPGELKR